MKNLLSGLPQIAALAAIVYLGCRYAVPRWTTIFNWNPRIDQYHGHIMGLYAACGLLAIYLIFGLALACGLVKSSN